MKTKLWVALYVLFIIFLFYAAFAGVAIPALHIAKVLPFIH